MAPVQEANSDNLGKSFRFSTQWGDSNEYTQHTIPWWNKKKNHQIFVFLSYWKNFVGTEKRVRIIHVKRAIRVPTIEVILYECAFRALRTIKVILYISMENLLFFRLTWPVCRAHIDGQPAQWEFWPSWIKGGNFYCITNAKKKVIERCLFYSDTVVFISTYRDFRISQKECNESRANWSDNVVRDVCVGTRCMCTTLIWLHLSICKTLLPNVSLFSLNSCCLICSLGTKK